MPRETINDEKVKAIEQEFDDFLERQMPIRGVRRSAILDALVETAELLCTGLRVPSGKFDQSIIALFLNVSDGLNKSLRVAHRITDPHSTEVYDNDLRDLARECIALGGVVYHTMENAFYSYWKGYAEATFPSENTLVFIPSGEDLGLNARLRYYSSNEELTPVSITFDNPLEIGSPVTDEFARCFESTGRFKDYEGFVYRMDESVVRSVADAHYKCIEPYFREVPDLELGNFTLSDLIQGWSIIKAVCQIHNLVSLLTTDGSGDLTTSINWPSLTRDREEWLRWFSSIRNRDEVIRALTFDFESANSDVAITPLVELPENRITVMPTATMVSNVARNIFVLLGRRYNRAYSTYTASKEDIIIDAFNKQFAALVIGERLNLPRFRGVQIPDIDLLVAGGEPNTLIVAEIKWQLSASTVKETIDRDEYLKKGQRQLSQIRDFLENNPNYLMDRGLIKFPITQDNVRYLLLCKGHLGSVDVISPNSIMADYDVFTRYISEYGIDEAVRRVATFDYLPKIDIDFVLRDFAVKFGAWVVGWKGFTSPELPPDTETDHLEDLYERCGKYLASL